jgi:hypothetical protein
MRSVFCFTLLDPGLGPLEVSYPVLPSGLEKPFFEAMKVLGVNPAPEPARVLLLQNVSVYWCSLTDPPLRQFTGNVS